MRKRRPARAGRKGRTLAHAEAADGVRVDDEFTGTVRDVSAAGSGVVEHPGGRVFFVPGAWTGESGTFRVTALKGRFGHARIAQLSTASSQRVEPACPHHGTGPADCGGCPWQFMDYAAQCAAKETRVRSAIGQLASSATVQPLWPSPDSYGYRNRAQLKTDGTQLGYVAAGSNTLAPISDCPILTAPNRATLKALLGKLPEPAWKPPRGQPWTSLDIDEGVTADSVAPNQRRAFRQGNSAQNARMRAWLAETMDPLERTAPVLELFCGDGNFTSAIAGLGFDSVVAVDSAQEAVTALDARRLPGVTTGVQHLYADDAIEKLRAPLRRAEILVLDPPRDGIPQIRSWLARARNLRQVLYISCDLATFTRDISRLLDDGFQLDTVQPLDQFPHTPHIELLARLSR